MINIHWFRRDLRLEDNAGLYHALKQGEPVLCIFIFDTSILEKLYAKDDARVSFIYQQIHRLKSELEYMGSSLVIEHGIPSQIWPKILKSYSVKTVFTNHDYEPYAMQRDKEVHDILAAKGLEFKTYKDQVVFEKNEVTKDDGSPYTVFTPYSKKWKALITDFYLKSYPTKSYFKNLYQTTPLQEVSLADIGFAATSQQFPEKEIKQGLIKNYEFTRDIPSLNGTSFLSLHFRFGTISIRQKTATAIAISEKWLNELIWREFYMYILYHFPHVVNQSFKPQYDRMEWLNDSKQFKQWCEGKTGYPIVDAGMRQLNTTGFMHNRVRMIVSSFLTKHLLIDWRWGEAYFAEKLLDYELASNNGGWQWAAGCGVDAAPYFRIFNPWLQTLKFDPEHKYINSWVPELETSKYPQPIVNHEMARKRCLETYKKALT